MSLPEVGAAGAGDTVRDRRGLGRRRMFHRGDQSLDRSRNGSRQTLRNDRWRSEVCGLIR